MSDIELDQLDIKQKDISYNGLLYVGIGVGLLCFIGYNFCYINISTPYLNGNEKNDYCFSGKCPIFRDLDK